MRAPRCRLNEITNGNVGRLVVKGTFSAGVLRGQEASPLVVNNILYVLTPHPNILYAVDLMRGGMPTK